MALIALMVFSWFCQTGPLPLDWDWEFDREFRSITHS
jgi:hypothetical protein